MRAALKQMRGQIGPKRRKGLPMKKFTCTSCGNRVHFENSQCLACEHPLGLLPGALAMVALECTDGTPHYDHADPSGETRTFVYCANRAHGVCNWLVSATEATGLCIGCSLNRTIPNLAEAGSLQAWRQLDAAKKRLLYSLLRFGLSLGDAAAPGGRLTFDFLRNTMTGHLNGVITIDIREAYSPERERQRELFQEPYRTLLGHMRHESGHFYWPKIVEGRGQLEPFRALFGDERQDYAQALGHHHGSGPPADWARLHISAYASSHPWEDWAETWAHYLHMVAVVDAAEAEGLDPRAAGLNQGTPWPFALYDAYRDSTFDELFGRWVPLTIAMNGLTRAMGHSDFYPFVIGDVARSKLAFVHDAIRSAADDII